MFFMIDAESLRRWLDKHAVPIRIICRADLGTITIGKFAKRNKSDKVQ
jgi:hypothetical protein